MPVIVHVGDVVSIFVTFTLHVFVFPALSVTVALTLPFDVTVLLADVVPVNTTDDNPLPPVSVPVAVNVALVVQLVGLPLILHVGAVLSKLNTLLLVIV